MTLLRRLFGDFRPGELRLALVLQAQFGLVVFALLLGRTVRDGLYLSRSGVQGLPWMYVGVAVVATLATAIYTRTLRGRVPQRVAPAVQAAMAAGFALFAAILPWAGPSVYSALYLWVEVLTILTVVQFWNLANERFHPRQAKRLYGFIAAGQALGNLACGAVASLAGLWLPVEALLWVVAGVSLALGLWYLQTSRRAALETEAAGAVPAVTTRPGGRQAAEDAESGQRRYVWAIVAVVALTYLATSWVDFQFKVIARRSLDEAELVRFFGQFYGAVGLVSFIVQFFLLRTFTQAVGLFGALLAMPLAFVMLGSILPALPFLAMATALKFSENGLRYAVYDPLLQTLYLPLPAQIRARVQSMASGMVKPLAMGAAGLLLVPLRPDQSGGLPAQWLGVPVALASLAVVVLLWRLRRGYLRVLADETADAVRRQRQRSRVRFDSNETMARVEHLILTGRDNAVDWVLRRVDFADPERWRSLLAQAAAREDLHLRLRAECVLDAEGAVDLSGAAPPVLRDFAALLSGQARWATVAAHLDAPDPSVREVAAWALFMHGRPEALLRARESLVVAAQGDVQEQQVAVALAAFLAPAERRQVLARAVTAADHKLARSALRRCAEQPDPDWGEPLVAALAQPVLRTDAVRALAALGEAGLVALQTRGQPWRTLGAAWPAFCREAAGVDWSAWLARVLAEEPDPVYWRPPAQALATAGVDGKVPDPGPALAAAQAWAGVAAVPAGEGTAARLITHAAVERRNAALTAALALALVRHPPPVERWARLLLVDFDSARVRANLAEILDQALPRQLRNTLVPLIEDAARPDPGARESLFSRTAPLLSALLDVAEGRSPREATMQDMIDRVLFLGSVPLFRALGGEDLEQIAELLEERDYAPQEMLIRRGEAGDSLYLVTEGRVRVHVGDETLAELAPGAVVGEMALLDDQPRSADVTALERVVALRLDRADFDGLLQAWPAIGRGVMAVLTERLRRANTQG